MTVLQKEQIKALRGQGLSYKEIADKVGVSKDTVKTFCRRNAIKAVTASEETKNKDCKENIDLCLQCGQPFTKTRNTKKFCSDACRLAYHKANRKPSAVCAHCGKKFDNNGNKKRKFCSTACYTADRFPEAASEKAVAV